MLKRVAIGAAAAAVGEAAIAADKVNSLPGWNGPLLSDMYAGYLAIPGGKHIHYIFVASLGNPKTDPLIYWSNGGPGCSSEEGMFAELGPYFITPGSKPPTLYANPHTIAKMGSLLIFDAPAGVGFSYADTPSGLVHNDTTTAADNLAALQTWLKGFPEYAGNDLYLSGESYAGVYIPTFANAIVNYNAAAPKKINLKGIAVGNGCTGTEIGVCGNDPAANGYNLDQWRGHGLISYETWSNAYKVCGDWTTWNAQCDQALNTASAEVGNINIYDIYGACINSGFPPSELLEGRSEEDKKRLIEAGMMAHRRRTPAAYHGPYQALTARLGGPNECIDAGDLTRFLNTPAVVSALHASPSVPWMVCSGNITYTPSEPNLPRDVYPNLIAANLRILVYNGEADACVPFTDNEAWTSNMGLEVLHPWHSWQQDEDNVAGYATSYANNFTFVTVRGAGHMVPETQPIAAYMMFDNYLNARPWV